MHNFLQRYFGKDFLLEGSLTYIFAFLTIIILPVYHWYLPPFMILWGVAWLLSIFTRTYDYTTIDHKARIVFVLFILFFIWQIIGMIYSDNPKEGWRNIELRMSLLVFPLVLFSPGNFIRKKSFLLLKIFALSTFAFLLVCFGYALYRSLIFNNGEWVFNPHPPIDYWLNYFYASELAIKQHPSYLSMFILFSGFISIESFLEKDKKSIYKYLWIFICLVLFLSIYLLSSRAEILAAIISLPVYLLFKFRNTGKRQLLVFLFALAIIVLIPLSISNPRFSYYYKLNSGKELVTKSMKEDRIRIWHSAVIIIKKNILFGVGTGDIQSELNKEYRKLGYEDILKVKNLNAHNQFVEIAAEHGLVGLIIFIAIFVVMTVIAVTTDNTLYLIFILIVFISFLFETMLNRLAGVSFFSLFSFLLLHVESKTKSK
ncbi:MAG: O-antigen ligase family protein [Bacteroidales bacterium]|nr:O-antigen ligase family protein [Bacteroidales bacterium]